MKDKLETIINYFGVEEQLVKLHEEIGELTIECIRGKHSNIVEEFADVVVLLRQLQSHLELGTGEVEEIIENKVDRTIKRIKEGYYEEHR